MKLITQILIASGLLISTASAVPNLQLFSPDGVYDAATETWVIGGGSFEIWVVAANLDKRDYFNITLVSSLRQGVDPFSGSLTITPFGGSSTTFGGLDYILGTPPSSDPLPAHGIFPTNYVETLVASSLTDGNETVLDYQPGSSGSNNFGKIFKFNVVSTYEFVHFDGYAFMNNTDGKRVFAPFSHDVSAVPEPTTMALFGLGLAGAGVVRRFRGLSKTKS